MQLFKTFVGKLAFAAVIVIAAIAANAQDARLNFERLNGLEARAQDVVEVNIEGKLLDLARRVMVKSNDKDAQKVSEAIKGLKGIYVRVYNFEKENEYNVADIDAIRSQLSGPGWEKLANVRSRKDNQKVDVFTMFQGDAMSGLAVVVSESKSIAVVNVIGPIDIDLLMELSGKMSIPSIDVERTDKNK